MHNTLEVRHVSVSIERAPQDVYRFASNIETWPQWASGLGESIQKVVFSVFRQPGTADADFQADARAVDKDLRALKHIMERR